jgi:putative ABC transport system permease protein
LALRDLARYRSRSGSALAAISLGVLIAVLICVLSASRYGNVLDYAGPNMTSNQLIVYTPTGSHGPGGPGQGAQSALTSAQLQSTGKSARGLATALGAHDIVQLDSTSASLQHVGGGRQFSGQVYVATPQLLRAFGITSADVNSSADILTMRPGLASMSHMQLIYGNYFSNNGPPGGGKLGAFPCPKTSCLANPNMEQVSALPPGTSAPNTVITEHAVHQLGLQSTTSGWLIQTPHPLTASQITSARLAAGAAGLSLETKNDQPSGGQIINWATVFGIFLALGVLAMTVGLIRSETASDLRILAATGASSSTRRTLTAATAGALGLLGAVLGTVAAYIATIAYTRSSSLDGLSSLSNIPARNLIIILVGMPIIAFAVGWLLAGREPDSLAQRPLE